MDVSIIITTKNESANLPAFFNSVFQCEKNGLKYEIVLVDANSQDSSDDVVKSFDFLPIVYEMICPSCGLLIGDAKLHSSWHRERIEVNNIIFNRLRVSEHEIQVLIEAHFILEDRLLKSIGRI